MLGLGLLNNQYSHSFFFFFLIKTKNYYYYYCSFIYIVFSIQCLKAGFSSSSLLCLNESFKTDYHQEQEAAEPILPELGFSEMMKKRQVVVKRDGSGRPSTTSSSVMRNVRYGECQKNHAANIGGYAVDGCREFMARGEEGSTGALVCAACGCHRNFHRREVETEVVCEYSPPNSSHR